MITPADILAGRLSSLGREHRDAVVDAWRRRGAQELAEQQADLRAARWSTPEGLAPQAGAPGWSADEEWQLLLGLDRLLALCHPDVGDVTDPRLPRYVGDELRARYLRNGWWHRSQRVLLLPQRLAAGGLRLVATETEPVSHTCVLLGDDVDAVVVVRLPTEDDPDGPNDLPLGASDCAVAPLVGAGALGLDFREQHSGRWTYGPKLDDGALTAELLGAVLDRADAAGASVLTLPEYACSPKTRVEWQQALDERTPGSVRWVLMGSGPTTADGEENVATLVSRDGKLRIDQAKVWPFDLQPGELSAWGCPTMPTEAQEASVAERVRLDRVWRVVECHRGRLVVSVCESLNPRIEDTTVIALGRVCPTLMLAPVFSKPTDDSWWERNTTKLWANRGTEVVVANSAVVAGWRAHSAGATATGGPIACGAFRRPGIATDERWDLAEVAIDPTAGAVTQVAMLASTSV